MVPKETVWPGATSTSETVPSRCALILFPIFIASITHSSSPLETRSPGLTATVRIFPGKGAVIGSAAELGAL